MSTIPLPAPSPMSATVVIDYQNVHLTGSGLFSGPDRHARDVLIDPVLYAQQVVAARNAVTDHSAGPATLSRVIVHRGLPALEHEPQSHHGNLLAAQGWSETAAAHGVDLTLCHSPLTYRLIRTAPTEPAAPAPPAPSVSPETVGHNDCVASTDATSDTATATATDGAATTEPAPTVIARGREKGVDVRCALDLVAAAAKGSRRDLVILASSDRDLTPALETAAAMRCARVEATAWLSRRALAPEGLRLWTTFLGPEHFEACIDPRAGRYRRMASALARTGAPSDFCDQHATTHTHTCGTVATGNAANPGSTTTPGSTAAGPTSTNRP